MSHSHGDESCTHDHDHNHGHTHGHDRADDESAPLVAMDEYEKDAAFKKKVDGAKWGTRTGDPAFDRLMEARERRFNCAMYMKLGFAIVAIHW